MNDQASSFAASKAASDRELALAEKQFASILRAAVKGGKYGRFGLVCSLSAGRIQLLRVQWEEHLKPTDPEPADPP
jgi:hypothetical protein